jgi:hypothetical protein
VTRRTGKGSSVYWAKEIEHRLSAVPLCGIIVAIYETSKAPSQGHLVIGDWHDHPFPAAPVAAPRSVDTHS